MTDSAEQVGGKILVVDDYPANVKLLQRNLQAAGYDTVVAYDGEEALAQVAAEQPDLVLLDIMMPKLNGFEVCRRLRADEATAVIPVIMVTALKETEDRIRGLEAGADDFLSKPFDRGELLARVKSLLQVKYYRSMLAEREKFHAVIQDLSHGIIITDGQWRVEIVSRKAAELLQRADEDLVGKNLAEVLADFVIEPSPEALRQTTARSVTVELAQEDRRPLRYLAGRYTRIVGPRGRLHNAALVFRDITEIRRKEKLKRDFLSLISHKLKTPITIVSGYLSLIDQGKYGDVPPAAANAIRICLVKVKELADLVEKVLSYAGLTATELERAGQLVPLGELIARVRNRIDERYGDRQVDWSIDVPADLPRVRAPEELLAIVVDNLLDNAVKFGDKPPIRVEVGVREIEGRRLELSIRDNGPGVPAGVREQIFAAFSQIEEEFTGNIAGIGLGLATARRLVESWGGRINYESTLGEGSCFYFTVPSEFSPPGEANDTGR